MKINELKYERKFSLGNYEMETIMAGASVDEGENPSDVLLAMMEFVNSKGGVSFQKDPAPVVEAPVEKVEVKAEEKKPAAKVKVKPAPAVDPAKVPATISLEEVKAEELKPAPKMKVKSAPTKYNRETDLHKKLVSEMLDRAIKGWKAKASLAKEASVKMNGEDFLDAEGKVLPSFTEAFVEMMK